MERFSATWAKAALGNRFSMDEMPEFVIGQFGRTCLIVSKEFPLRDGSEIQTIFELRPVGQRWALP